MKENSEIKQIMENETNNLQATCPVLFPESERRSLLEIERSLIKRYRKNIFSLIENYILHIRNKINSDNNLQYHIELSNIYEEINKKANIKDINNYILNKVN